MESAGGMESADGTLGFNERMVHMCILKNLLCTLQHLLKHVDRCGNVAAILELDENLNKKFIFLKQHHRHAHNVAFQKSDLFFVCMMKALSNNIMIGNWRFLSNRFK